MVCLCKVGCYLTSLNVTELKFSEKFSAKYISSLSSNFVSMKLRRYHSISKVTKIYNLTNLKIFSDPHKLVHRKLDWDDSVANNGWLSAIAKGFRDLVVKN